jgi:hypothetical protein
MRRLAALVLPLVLAVIPAVELHCLLWLFFRKRITDYIPNVGDWIYYWHEAASIAVAGINGGIYGNEETGSPASVLLQKGVSFTHSILFPVLQGTYGRVFGWNSYSPILFNILVVSSSLFFLGLVARRSIAFLCVAIFFIASFIIVLTNVGLCNQEATNIAIGIGISALYIALLLAPNDQKAKPLAAFILAFTWFCCLIRVDWVVAFIPVIFSPGSWLKQPTECLKRVGLFLLLASTSVAFYFFFFSSYPYELYSGAQQHGMILYQNLLSGDPGPLYNHVKGNLSLLATPQTYSDNPLLILCVLFMTFAFVYFCFSAINTIDAAWRKKYTFFATTIFANILFIVFLFVFFYNVFFMTRLLVPHFILSFFVMAYFLPWQFATFVLLFNISASTSMMKQFRDHLSSDYGIMNAFSSSTLRQESDRIKHVLQLSPNKNPWCNTLLILSYNPGIILHAVPSGIAFQNMRLDSNDIERPYKYSKRKPETPFLSKYIFVDSKESQDFISKHNKLVHLLHVSSGDFYLNLSSPYCQQ